MGKGKNAGKAGKGKKSKARPLTGLAAALVKSGHLDEKKARTIARENRREEKQLGRDGVAAREAGRRAAAEAQLRAEAEAQRARQRAHEADKAEERIRRAIRDGLAPPPRRGNRQWFFQTRDGRVPFLEVSDDLARQLSNGSAGIVESCGAYPDCYVVVDASALVTLIGIDRELVRFWNRPSGP